MKSRGFKVQTEKKTVFIHSDAFHTKIQFPDWLSKSSVLATVSKHPSIIKEERWVLETVVVPLSLNHSRIKLKPIAKNKESRTACLTTCVQVHILYDCCQDISSFFCHCIDFLHDIYSVILTIQNTMQP